MSQPQAVLDYASPGRAGRFRVGSRSVIDIYDRGDRVDIVERLEGRGVAALLILIDLALIGLMVFGVWRSVLRSWRRASIDGEVLFVGVFALVFLAALFLAVLHNWASTRLVADSDKLTLTFANPARRRMFEANRLSIHQIGIETTGATRGVELRIVSSKHDLRLFTAHPYAELVRIVDALQRVLKLDRDADAVPYATVMEELPYAQVVDPSPGSVER